MLIKLFWILVVVTFIFVGVHLAGFPVLEIIVLLVIVELLILKINQKPEIYKDEGHPESMIGVLADKLSKIEDKFGEFITAFKEKEFTASSRMEQVTLGGIEKTLDRYNQNLRVEVKDSMDKMAKKLIDIENKIEQHRRSFSAAVGSIDDRLRNLEEDVYKEEVADEDVI